MSRKTKIIFSFIILIVGLFIFASEYFDSKKIEVYDYMNELYYNESNQIVDQIDELDEVNEEVNEEEYNNIEDSSDTSYKFEENNDTSLYIGYLIIPDINFKKGFTEKNSSYNNVNRNIQILSSSSYPDEELGNVIIAGHSGNSSVSYFNKLYLLNKGAKVIVNYNNVNYIYEINNIYTVEKTGKVEIKRDKNKSCITLITCTKDNKTTQTVYIGELISKE